MRTRTLPGPPGAGWGLILAVVLAASGRVCGAEPLETIGAAFRAASQGLSSGIGKGTYRQYEAVAGGDWRLKQDADLATYFDGRKYHIELKYHRDEFMKVDSRRIIFDGQEVTEASFAPGINPTGAEGRVIEPETFGTGVSKPSAVDFPWDVSWLPANIWHPERLVANLTPRRIQVVQTPEGDLVGTYSLLNTDRAWVRFECPRNSGFNLARKRVFNVGQAEPAEDVRIEWKPLPTGLWYVRSMDQTDVSHDPRIPVQRIRRVLKYTEFQPNAKVDPHRFLEASLGLPSRSRILDWRPGARTPFRVVP